MHWEAITFRNVSLNATRSKSFWNTPPLGRFLDHNIPLLIFAFYDDAKVSLWIFKITSGAWEVRGCNFFLRSTRAVIEIFGMYLRSLTWIYGGGKLAFGENRHFRHFAHVMYLFTCRWAFYNPRYCIKHPLYLSLFLFVSPRRWGRFETNSVLSRCDFKSKRHFKGIINKEKKVGLDTTKFRLTWKM